MVPDTGPELTAAAVTAESEQPIFTERRRRTRYQFTATTELLDMTSRTRVQARTSDLSSGGCYVDTTSPLPVGTIVKMRLSKDNRSFDVDAKVVYSLPGMGMGLAFTAAVPEQLEVLKRWIGELSGQLTPEFSGPEHGENVAGQDSSHAVLGTLLMELVRQGVLPAERGKGMLSQLMNCSS
jgi:hypothetical protein